MRFLPSVSFALLAAAATVSSFEVSPLAEHEYRSMYASHLSKHGLQREAHEIDSRLERFKSVVDHVRKHNANPQRTSTMAVNKLADLTPEEFRANYLGLKKPQNAALQNAAAATATTTTTPSQSSIAVSGLPATRTTLDWRSASSNPKGITAVTPVKDQGQCGSCWSFSTTGVVEGAWALSGNPLTSFAEQELLDCSGRACGGGWPTDALNWVKGNNGLPTEADYPYTARQGSCQSSSIGVSGGSLSTVTEINTESDLKTYLDQGPVSICLEADSQVFQSYSSGVIDDPSCGTQQDHAILAVGYGTDSSSGLDFWLIKNSWGTDWGDQGYFRIVRGKGMCGIGTNMVIASSGSNPTPSVTYSWVGTGWSLCSATQCGKQGTQTQNYQCQGSDGSIVSGSAASTKCGSMPSKSQACSPVCSYVWNQACGGACVNNFKQCTVTCQGTLSGSTSSVTVANSYCTTVKPASQIACVSPSSSSSASPTPSPSSSSASSSNVCPAPPSGKCMNGATKLKQPSCNSCKCTGSTYWGPRCRCLSAPITVRMQFSDSTVANWANNPALLSGWETSFANALNTQLNLKISAQQPALSVSSFLPVLSSTPNQYDVALTLYGKCTDSYSSVTTNSWDTASYNNLVDLWYKTIGLMENPNSAFYTFSQYTAASMISNSTDFSGLPDQSAPNSAVLSSMPALMSLTSLLVASLFGSLLF